jgi:hypothetical protein
MQNLLPEVFLKLTDLLLPHVQSPDDREALLIEAFYLVEPRLFNQIPRKGNPRTFSIICNKIAHDFGCLPNKQSALKLLMRCYQRSTKIVKKLCRNRLSRSNLPHRHKHPRRISTHQRHSAPQRSSSVTHIGMMQSSSV